MAKMFDDHWAGSQSSAHRAWRAGRSNRRGIVNALRRHVPVRQILLFLLAVFSFKIFLFFDLGGAAYGAKVIALSEGNGIERVLGYAMALDPMSQWVVDGIRFGVW